MTLEFRPSGEPHCFDLTEGEERIGELGYCAPEEEGDEPYWPIQIWSVMGTGKTWTADTATSHEEAAEQAHELYGEFVAERRELSRGAHPRTVSVPMGGQKRRR